MSTLFGFTDPFADLLDMQRQMDRLMSAFTADVPSLLTTTTTPTTTAAAPQLTAAARPRARPRWSLSLDVWETEQSIVLHAELPGCSLDDIKLSVTGDNRLVLEGHKRTAEKMEKKMKEERWVRRERFEGDFYRTLLLPAGVEASQIRADYANGVLEVVIPKPTRERGAKRQIIDIKEGLGAKPQPQALQVEQQPKVEKTRAEEGKTEERVEAQPPQFEKKEETKEEEMEEKMEQPPLEKKEEVKMEEQLETKEEEKMEQPPLVEKEEVKEEEERVEAQPPQLEKKEEPTEKKEEEAKPTEEAKQETIEIKTPEETTTAEEQPQVEQTKEEKMEERVEVQPPQLQAEKEVPIEPKPTEEGKQETTTAEAEQKPQEEEQKEKPQEEQKKEEGYAPTTQGERSFIGEGEAH